jgi:hypothetical protein
VVRPRCTRLCEGMGEIVKDRFNDQILRVHFQRLVSWLLGPDDLTKGLLTFTP